MKIFTATGSHGTIKYDETGLVVDCSDGEYGDIVRVDVDEYVQYNGHLDDTDIILIGFWTKDGLYEPPSMEHRLILASEAH